MSIGIDRRLATLAAVLAFALSSSAAGVATAIPARADLQPHVFAPFSEERTFGALQEHIQHVVIIMQENRSFDSYFGTFPGANGIPMVNGHPAACVHARATSKCVYPFHLHADKVWGGPHGYLATRADIDGGAMDGFIAQAETDPKRYLYPDQVMGYKDERELPNYWSYAKNYVLMDGMFAPSIGWSALTHQYMVSGWSAKCTVAHDPMSCSTAVTLTFSQKHIPPEPWTDITWLLHGHGVSWGYYKYPDNHNGGGMLADPYGMLQDPDDAPVPDGDYTMTTAWNPLPGFDDVITDGQIGNIQPGANFDAQAIAGTLPAVSWVVSSFEDSEHPHALTSRGQAFVTNLVNEVMGGPDWNTTAIFISWDDWGGFYDHVVPPKVDKGGYGLRVPCILVSPWALHGVVDHQLLSFDAFLKFIEDDFLGGARIDPRTDGRPDSRPDVRENYLKLGDLRNDFNFAQVPMRPKPLPTWPR